MAPCQASRDPAARASVECSVNIADIVLDEPADRLRAYAAQPVGGPGRTGSFEGEYIAVTTIIYGFPAHFAVTKNCCYYDLPLTPEGSYECA